MPYQYEEKPAAEGGLARVLSETYEPGLPEGKEDGCWRQKLGTRTEALGYLKSAERYWYGESFGSEKRKGTA